MTPTAPAIEPEDYRRLVGFKLLLLAILGVAIYLNSLYGVLVLKEGDRRMLANPDMRSLALTPKAWLSPTRTADWSLALNYAISGYEPWSYHLFNIALHTLAALALYGVVCRTLVRLHGRPRLQEAAPWLAFLIALLWLTHPLQTETVDYLARRGDLLAGLFTLTTLYCVVRGADGERAAIWYGLAVLACFLGTGSAWTAAAAPLVVLIYDRIYLAQSWRELWRRRAGLYVGLAACWVLLAVSVSLVGYDPRALGFSAPATRGYALAQPGVVLHDLGLVFWPLGICFDYFDWPLNQPSGSYVLPFLVVGALLAATAWALFRRPKIGYLGAWFFLTLAPTSSFIPHAEAAGDDRMYLPLAAVAILVVLAGFALVQWAGERAPWAAYAAVGVALLAGGVLAFMTFQRNAAYEDPLAIWEDTITKRPGDVPAQFQLNEIGNFYLRHYLAYRAVNSDHFTPERVMLAGYKAEQAYRAVAKAQPGAVEGAQWFNEFGYRLWTNELPAKAASFFQEAVRLQPETAKYHFNLALALLDIDDNEGAERERKEGLKLDPDWPTTAREQAWKKATDADPMQRNALQALFLARQACMGDGGRHPECLDALAAANAAAGRFKEAAAKAEQARQLADAQHDDALSRDIGRRLSLYKEGKPFIRQ